MSWFKKDEEAKIKNDEITAEDVLAIIDRDIQIATAKKEYFTSLIKKGIPPNIAYYLCYPELP